MRKHALTAARFVLGLALLAFVLSRTTDWATAARLLDHPGILLFAAALPVVGALIEALRLVVLFRPQGIRLRVGRAYGVVAVSALFNFAVPGGTGGDVMKLYYLGRERRDKLVEIAAILVGDRAIALFALLLLILGLTAGNLGAVTSVGVLEALVWMVAGLVLALVGLGAVFSSRALRRTGLYRFLTTRAPFHRVLERLADAALAVADAPRAVLAAIALTMIGHVLLIGMYMLLASAVMPGAPPTLVGLLALVGMLANAIPLTPGGLGVGEAAFDRLFSLFGYANGALLVLTWRLGTIPLALVGFLVYVLGVRGVSIPEPAESRAG